MCFLLIFVVAKNLVYKPIQSDQLIGSWELPNNPYDDGHKRSKIVLNDDFTCKVHAPGIFEELSPSQYSSFTKYGYIEGHWTFDEERDLHYVSITLIFVNDHGHEEASVLHAHNGFSIFSDYIYLASLQEWQGSRDPDVADLYYWYKR